MNKWVDITPIVNLNNKHRICGYIYEFPCYMESIDIIWESNNYMIRVYGH
jgi:hypothetical protein